MATDQPAFRHEPLPDAENYIRLLVVTSVDEGRPVSVHCEMSVWPVEEVPTYCAISYTWGSPDLTTLVLVNGSLMRVRQNCEYVLKQASWYGDNERNFIWCDAICIDQESNQEKSSQVAMMGRIFHEAQLVLACVGEHADDSEFLYQTLQNNAVVFDELETPDRRARTIRMWMIRHLLTIPRLYASLGALVRRSYFSRVWVYQELALGQNVHLCCGRDALPMTLFRRLAADIRGVQRRGYLCTLSEVLDSSDTLAGFLDNSYLESLNQPLFLRQSEPSARKAWPLLCAGVDHEVRLPMEMAVHNVAPLACEDPRDTIYGVLAMIDWRGEQPLQPDYTKDRFDLALEVLQRLRSDSSISDGWHPLDTALTVVRNLKLTIDPPDELVQAARIRHKLEDDPADSDRESSSAWLSKFLGCRLEHDGLQWRPWTSLRAFQGPQLIIQQWPVYSPALLSSQAISDSVLLPPSCKSGDYCLIQNGKKFDDTSLNIVLIAREETPSVPTSSNRFRIVGKGLMRFAHRSRRPFSHFDNFRVFLDCEDALVMVSTLDLLGDFTGIPSDQVSDFLQTKVCGYLGSSWIEVNENELPPVDSIIIDRLI